MLLEVEIPEVKRRKISRRIDGNPEGHYHFEKKEDELRIHTFYPFLESLISGLNERFSQESMQLVCSVGQLLYFNCDPDNAESNFNYV